MSFKLIAGPCVIENEAISFTIAEHLKTICQQLNINLYFKASFKKANRTSLHSFSSIGTDAALKILQKIKEQLQLPIVTDVHECADINYVKDIVDVIQIPALLCRQTDLLLAAGNSGKIVNIKKGQFANATQLQFAYEKVASTKNSKIWITERGNSFGYQDLIVDFRNITLLKETPAQVFLDITHSVQQPNITNGTTSGQPQFIATLAKCGIVAGVDGIFLETHPNPSQALSDAATMLPLANIVPLLNQLVALHNFIKQQ